MELNDLHFRRTIFRLIGLTSTAIKPLIYFFVNDRMRRGFLGQFLPFYTPPMTPATPLDHPIQPFIRFTDDAPRVARKNSRKSSLLRTINARFCRHRLAPLATIDEFNELSEEEVV